MNRSTLTDHDRTSGRHPVDLAAAVRVPGAKVRAQICRLRNLSIGGTFVELGRLPMGTQISITFGLPTINERLSLDAVVQWATDEGVGVQFEGLRAWEVWVLWRYLESLAAQQAMFDDTDLDDISSFDADTVRERMPTVEDDTQAERHDVYAHYGLAMNRVHALERRIAHAMIVSARSEPLTGADLDAILARDYQRPLRQLVHSLSWHVSIDPILESLLDDALAARHWLVHECFRDNAEQLHSHDGRVAMLGSFIDVTELLRRADEQLREHLRPVRDATGVDDEELDRIRGALLASRSERPAARARDSSDRVRD